MYFKLFKLIGAFCVFLVVGGASHAHGKYMYYIIFLFSFTYTIYGLFITIYFIIETTKILFKGKFIVQKSPHYSSNKGNRKEVKITLKK